MATRKRVPAFKSEAEEAKWWSEHRDEFEDYMNPVVEDGTPLHVQLGLTPKSKTKTVALRLSVQDIERAKLLAAKKGIGYQTLLKMIIHEGLQAEISLAASRQQRRALGG